MKITFLGGTHEVTGSKYLVEHEGTRVLVDCGLFQGHEAKNGRNRKPFPIDPSSIDAVVLTHAHIDHTGYLPLLVKNGFKGKIYCSKATYALCAILLMDSAQLYEEAAKRKNNNNDGNTPQVEPLYTKKDAEQALQLFEVVDYNKAIQIGSFEVTLIQSYHILGASFVMIFDGKRTLTFSGDLGRPKQLVMKTPPYITETDYLVLESTYGDRIHEQGDPIQALEQIIQQTIAKGGKLIIPTFAVGRSQTILYCLYQLRQKKIIPNIPIFLDSPMAIKVTDLFCKFKDEHKLSSHCSDVFNIATNTPGVEESKHINTVKHPIIIIAGSGMADGGRVIHHFKQLISDPKNTILFVGYQAEDTNGRALIEGAQEIELFDKFYQVHAEIKTIDMFSAHADYNEILDWLKHFESGPKKVFLIHGEIEAAMSLKNKIEEQFNWKVVIPKYQETFDL